MHTRSGSVSTVVVSLLVVVVVLASSTMYFAYQAFQPKPSSLSTTEASQTQQSLHLPTYNVAAAVGQSATVSSTANSITVVASGQVSFTPNEALLQVSVQTDSSTAEGATSANAQSVGSVIRALNGIGVSNSSIQTQGYTLSPTYSYCSSSCIPQITGYAVTNTIQVNMTSNDPAQLGLKVGQVIDTSVHAGANGISLSFGATNAAMNQLTNAALQSAVASADSQAKAIASSLGVTVSGVISASESGYYSSVYTNTRNLDIAGAASKSATPVIPGTQTISATVQVIYAIS